MADEAPSKAEDKDTTEAAAAAEPQPDAAATPGEQTDPVPKAEVIFERITWRWCLLLIDCAQKAW